MASEERSAAACETMAADDGASSWRALMADAAMRRLFVATLLYMTAFQAAYFTGFISTATYAMGAGAGQVTVLVALLSGTFVAGNAISGVLIDRFGPRRTLAGACAADALVMALAFLVGRSYWNLVALASCYGLFSGAASTTLSAFPPYLVQGRARLKDANGLNDTAIHVAIMVGPVMGGILSSAVSAWSVYVFSLLLFVAATAEALRLRERFVPGADDAACSDGPDGGGDAGSGGGFWRDFADGLRVTFASPDLRAIFAIGFFGFFAYGAFDSLESVFYRDVLRVGPEWMGYLVMISGAGSVAGSVMLLRVDQRHVGLRLLSAMLLLTGVGSVVYVGTSNLACACVGQVLAGIGFGVMMPVQHMLVQERCELGYVGRVSSVMRIGLNSAGVLPMLVAPFLADAFGVQAVLVAASASVAVIGVGFLAAACRHER